MNKKSHSAVQAIIEANTVDKRPTVNILSFDLAGEGMARVLCSINHTGDSRENPAKVATAIRTALGGKMEAVAGSFSRIERGEFQEQVSGIVSVVREAMPMTRKNLQGFRSISANMFMDDEEHMWTVHKSAAGDLVVKTTGIDDDLSLLKLLNEACSGTSSLSSVSDYHRMVACASSLSERVQGGDFVSYVNINNEISCGYVVATVLDEANPEVTKAIVVPITEDAEEVNTKAITEIHDQDKFPEVEVTEREVVDTVVASARGTVSLTTLLDYYKRVYARRPAFYNEFARRIRAHAFL